MTEEERIAKEQELLQANEAKAAMIAELQAERQRRQAAEEELKRTKGDQEPKIEGSDAEKLFKELLKKKEDEDSLINRESALNEFRNSVKEFSKDNDEAGIVFSAFERELKKFNLNGLSSKEDFKKRFKEVHEFMNRGNSIRETPEVPYRGSNLNNGPEPRQENPDNLSDVERKLIKDMDWTLERYLKQKASRPHYVASLLQYRS